MFLIISIYVILNVFNNFYSFIQTKNYFSKSKRPACAETCMKLHTHTHKKKKQQQQPNQNMLKYEIILIQWYLLLLTEHRHWTIQGQQGIPIGPFKASKDFLFLDQSRPVGNTSPNCSWWQTVNKQMVQMY